MREVISVSTPHLRLGFPISDAILPPIGPRWSGRYVYNRVSYPSTKFSHTAQVSRSVTPVGSSTLSSTASAYVTHRTFAALETHKHCQPDGRLMEGSPSANDDGFSTFFSETGSGKHVPRSLYVSLDQVVHIFYRNRRV